MDPKLNELEPVEARPTGKGCPSEVVVTASKETGGWSFTMSQDGAPAEQLRFSKDNEGMRKVDWHDILFRLVDPSGGLAFHPDKDQAIWVARGTADQAPPCPNRKGEDPKKGFRPVGNPTATELRVRNDNAEVCQLSYRLNFVAAGSGSTKIVAFHDPVIGNTNGGRD